MMRLPRYFIGQFQSQLEIARGLHQVDGEQHFWSPDWTPGDPNAPAGAPFISPSSLIFVVHRSGIPHPHWRELPHILDSTPVKAALAPPTGQPERRASLIAAWAQTVVPVLGTDTTFSLVKKLHKQMAVFEP